jgi:O-antigen/teichoic acid export membrane protein
MDQLQPASPSVGAATSIHRIARNSVLSLAATLLNAAFALVVVIVLARTLGKDPLGRYYSVYVATVVVQLVLEAGLSTVLTRRVAHSNAAVLQSVAEARALFFFVGAGSCAVLTGLGLAWSYAAGETAPIRFGLLAGIACWAIQIEQLAAGAFRGIERFDLEAAAKVLQGLVLALLVIVHPPRGSGGVDWAVGYFMASHLAAALFSWLQMQRLTPSRRLRLTSPILRDWLSEAIPLGIGDILRRLTFQIDHLLLALMQPFAVLGLYSVAYRPLGPLSLVPRAIVSATFPYFARVADHDPAAMKRGFTANTRLLWIISLPMAVTIAALAEPIIRVVAGPAFLDAVAPMRVLAFVLVLSYPSTQFRFALTACGRQKLFTWLALAGLVFETAVEAALIPRFGYMGACTGFLIGEIGFTLLGLVVCQRLGLGEIPVRAMVFAMPAAGLMTMVLLAAHPLPYVVQFALAGVFAVVYFALCLAFGAVRRWEMQLIAGALLRPIRRRFGPPAGRSPIHARAESDLAVSVRDS